MNLPSQLSILGEKRELLLDKSYATVVYFPDNKIGYIYWKKYTSLDEYKEVYETLLVKQEKVAINYLISDITHQGVSSTEKKEWFKEYATKRAIKNGLIKVAAIIDNNPFKVFYTSKLLKMTNMIKFPFKTFNSVKAAKEWLLN